MSNNLDINLGVTNEQGDDRLQCLALEHGVSKEEVAGWALSIGMTVMEIAAGNPDTRVWVLNGDNSRFISLPTQSDETTA